MKMTSKPKDYLLIQETEYLVTLYKAIKDFKPNDPRRIQAEKSLKDFSKDLNKKYKRGCLNEGTFVLDENEIDAKIIEMSMKKKLTPLGFYCKKL